LKQDAEYQFKELPVGNELDSDLQEEDHFQDLGPVNSDLKGSFRDINSALEEDSRRAQASEEKNYVIRNRSPSGKSRECEFLDDSEFLLNLPPENNLPRSRFERRRSKSGDRKKKNAERFTVHKPHT
jgi:hypothetical protein